MSNPEPRAPEVEGLDERGVPSDGEVLPWRGPATDPLGRLAEIRSWVDRSWPKDVTNTQWTWLMIDLGHIGAALRQSGQPTVPIGLQDEERRAERHAFVEGYQRCAEDLDAATREVSAARAAMAWLEWSGETSRAHSGLQDEERERLADVVRRLIAWSEKYPSRRVYDHHTIVGIAAEIDSIAASGRLALRAPSAATEGGTT